MVMVEMNEGARRANDIMHQQKLQSQNERLEQKLDEIIQLLKELLARKTESA